MTTKQKELIKKLIYLKRLRDMRLNKEFKVNKYLSRYGLRTDGFICPSCGYNCLLYILRGSDESIIKQLPKKLKILINDESSFHCLNCHWEGLIVEM